MIVVLRRDMAIDKVSELDAGNSDMRARSTVVYMKHRKAHYVVGLGCVVVVMKNIENEGGQLCPLLYRKEAALVTRDLED